MADRQWEEERTIFDRFSAAAELDVAPESVRRGEGYDIACSTRSGRQLAFELTEAADERWAASLGQMMSVSALLNEALHNSADPNAAVIRQRFAGFELSILLMPGAGARLLRRHLSAIFRWLAEAPTDKAELEPPTALRIVVKQVKPRAIFPPPLVLFHSPGSAMWLGDETNRAIRQKLAKPYPRDIGLQLLVYYHLQPSMHGAGERALAMLEGADAHAFSTVWLYDEHSNRVLLRYPDI